MVKLHEPLALAVVGDCVQLTKSQLLGLRLSSPPARVKMNQSPLVGEPIPLQAMVIVLPGANVPVAVMLAVVVAAASGWATTA
jgi:hypothetical protein